MISSGSLPHQVARRNAITIDWNVLEFSNENGTCDDTYLSVYSGLSSVTSSSLVRYCGSVSCTSTLAQTRNAIAHKYRKFLSA